MKTEIVDGKEHITVDPKTENCVICDTPLKDVSFDWNVFHGSAKSSCCGVDYQLKSYYVNEDKSEELKAYAKSLDSPDKIECSCKREYIEPLKKAMKALNETALTKSVIDMAHEEVTNS